MSERPQGRHPKEQPSPMAARLQQARELTEWTVAGVKSTAESAASMAASEAGATADAADVAMGPLADSLGKAVTDGVQGAARSTGAMVGGLKGTASGLLLAAQIGGAAAIEAARALAGGSLKAAGRTTEGMMLGIEDQQEGAEALRETTRDLAQETFDATTGAALGALGGLATAVGAVAGGTKGALEGTIEGVQRMADAGAEATWVVGREASKGSTEMLRRALRRPEGDASPD